VTPTNKGPSGPARDDDDEPAPAGRARLVKLILIGVAVVAAGGFLAWRALAERREREAEAAKPEPDVALEVEPNDTVATCQPLPRAARLLVRGTTAPGNEDWYCLPSPNFGAHLQIELGAVPGCDLDLEVTDAHGRAVVSGGPTRRGPRAIMSGVAPGGRALVVRPAAGCRPAKGGSYELRLDVQRRLEADWEREPNDAPEKATPMHHGTPMIGYITNAGDVDWFHVPVQPSTPDQRLRVDVAAAPMVALRVEVVGEDQGRVYQAVGRAGDTLILRGLGIRSWESTYGVKVTAESGAGPQRPYELRAELETVQGAFEFEPNDTPQQSTPLPVGTGEPFVLSGYLSTPGDLDFYSLSLLRTMALEIGVEGLADTLTVEATLLDERGETPLRCRTGAPCGGKPATKGRIEMAAPSLSRGNYALRVEAAEGQSDPRQPYRVTARYGATPKK
jgi:hypothetical protein